MLKEDVEVKNSNSSLLNPEAKNMHCLACLALLHLFEMLTSRSMLAQKHDFHLVRQNPVGNTALFEVLDSFRDVPRGLDHRNMASDWRLMFFSLMGRWGYESHISFSGYKKEFFQMYNFRRIWL